MAMATHLLRHGSTYWLLRNCRRSRPLTLARCLHFTPCLEKKVAFNLSDIGEGIREVTVKEWFVKVGDTVEQFDNLCEVQSDKASVTITSRYDGKITKIYHSIDELALVGKPLLEFEVEDAEEEEEGEAETSSSDSSDSDLESGQAGAGAAAIPAGRHITPATPAVRRLAKEHKVNLSEVPPTGKNGRVLKGDVLEYLGQVPPGTNVPHPSNLLKQKTAPPAAAPDVAAPADRVEPLKGVRKAMLKSMTESLKIPHFAYSDEIDMSNLVKFRAQLQSAAQEQGVPKLTFMPFCIKAASIALAKYPIVNSSLDLASESIVYKGVHNISVAIDTPQGLVVPNIKNCQAKGIIQIAKDLNALVERGRTGSLTPADFADGTFSLSNIGIVGGTYTHPCIMAPQVAIGAMGRTKAVPRFNEKDELIKAHIMSVSWSADHRVIDGVTMASFSNVWKQHLEQPALFLLR
ncbi:lipoamide acyltransferase component of branched-chain alpha-keto acid dehydrogenase complex, mitochondrial [Drosophila novamexicana]|uniref:lipoamide acyltransferase component of branched-chain alpha-keto acid dehydrogenase complex, mitochondrial n=1 Tax=Drosophila novamexicana TaxID=47314 RepID=UPI0011E59A76|nr:lipoamide acyltransferase component of branched-chain alpha-keto acid dehydrogenase complex, mitochondrial [Drosophila novamexicana]